MQPYGVAGAYMPYWNFIIYLQWPGLLTSNVSSRDKWLAISSPFYDILPINKIVVPINELLMVHFIFKMHALFLCRNSASLKNKLNEKE